MAGVKSQVADPTLAEAGEARIAWAADQMPVLAQVGGRFARQRPLAGVSVAVCLHVTPETANLMRVLVGGGAQAMLCAANPLVTQDDVAAALVTNHGVTVLARRGESRSAYEDHIAQLAAARPQLAVDDGADLILAIHSAEPRSLAALLGATEETTTGLVRLRAMAAAGRLRRPVLAVNEALTERAFNDRFGAGQSTLDGIVRATNQLLAGHTVVVLGYGWTGRGVALRARGAGALVVVCEVDPLRALEARMEGYMVMPALRAAEVGDIFITVTGSRNVLRGEHFKRMKDGAILANAGHFDVEINIDELRGLAADPPREVLPLVERYQVGDRALNLLAGGRVVNLAAAAGHPAAVMDLSFASQALAVEYIVRHAAELPAGVVAPPPEIDREVARLKLESLRVEIDELSGEQRAYLSSWEGEDGEAVG